MDAKPLQPLILLYVRNPWLLVIGSDSPRFALYENGLVIYPSGRKNPEEAFLSALLSFPELQELLATLDLERRLAGLDERIDASNTTDLPTNELHYRVNGQPRAINVYGDLRQSAPERERVPEAFLEVFDALTGFRAKGAEPWLPPVIEVMIWPASDYSEGKKPARPWPKGWPNLDDPTTRRRKGESYSLFLQSERFPELLRLLCSLGNEQVVLIGDKEWAISYRTPFPGGF